MSTFRKPFLIALTLPAIAASTWIAGCNAPSPSSAEPHVTPAGNTLEKPNNTAPEDSSAADGASKSGQAESAAGAMKVGAATTKLDFASVPAPAVGQKETWTLKITDAKAGRPVSDFETVHDKLMHLIVVARDLSWFNHLHPTYKGQGVFTVSAVLPRAGTYKMYADYTPKGGHQEVPQHEISTAGTPISTAQASLVPDKMRGPWLMKSFTSHPEGEPDKAGGARYSVALMPMPMPLKAGQDSMLHFQIRDAAGKPVSDLQPYLGALGHCVILSQDTTKYLHSHPMADGMEGGMAGMDHSKAGGSMGGSMGGMKMDMKPEAPKSGGPDVMFHTNFPEAGIYKAWGQFKHRGQVITASFVINVAPGEANSAASAPEHSHDESQPHSH